MIARLVTTAFLFIAALAATPAAQAQHYGGGGQQVECRSRDYRFTRCEHDWNDARLVHQTSDAHCIRGRTWGVDHGGLWVDRGCSGVFERVGRHQGGGYGGPDHGRGHDGGGWRPGPDWDQDIRFHCRSHNHQYNFCAVDIGRGGRVYIVNQISDAHCIEGRTWGTNRAGVWVNGGCEAEFVVERRWR